MHLKLTAGEPGQRAFISGYCAKLELDGVDVSKYTSDVTVHAGVEGAIGATIKFWLTGLEIDVPAALTPVLDLAETSGTLAETPES